MIPNEVRDMIKKNRSRLPVATYETRSFDTWRWSGDPEGPIDVPEEMLETWRAFGKWRNGEPPFLFIYGPKGVGKTHLALAEGWGFFLGLEGKAQVLFYQVEGLMDTIRAGFDSGESNELLEDVKNCYLLILDDLGAQKLTEWSVAKLDSIIDHRYIEGMLTVVTSNFSLDPKYKDRIPERIADRIREGISIRLRGESKRGAKDAE